MNKFTKTIKLRLRKPNKGKEEELYYLFEQSGVVARRTAERMSSISPHRYDRYMDSVYYNWVKEFRNNGIDLPAQTVQEIVQKIRSNFLSWWNGERKEKPMPEPKDHSWSRFHNRQIKAGKHIFRNGGTYYINIPIKPRKRITLPFFPGDYQDYFLERLVGEKLDHGVGELVNYDCGYYLNLSVKKPIELDYEPKTFIGIDIGLNILAWAAALDSNGEFLDETHFDGGEAGHIRNHYWKLRKELQESGNIDKVKEMKNKEQRWMENKNHTISRRIIEFAEQFEKPLILLENINMNQLRKRVDNPKIHSWTAGKLRDFILYKGEEKEIKTELVNPKNTSKKCPKCNHISGNNRNGVDFKCEECGYENHADFVGAWNIARGGKND